MTMYRVRDAAGTGTEELCTYLRRPMPHVRPDHDEDDEGASGYGIDGCALSLAVRNSQLFWEIT